MFEKNTKKPAENNFTKKITYGYQYKMTDKQKSILKDIDTNTLINIKEINSFSLMKSADNIPEDIFNIVCNQIIVEIANSRNIHFTNLRDTLYDILIYNLDVVECLWYILMHFIMEEGKLKPEDISDILEKTYIFLKYFNNNYRPIYHLESIIFYLITKLNNYE